jgi:hypothetical protein
MVVSEWWSGKYLEGDSRGLVKGKSRHSTGETDENTRNVIQDSQSLAWYLNPDPPNTKEEF